MHTTLLYTFQYVCMKLDWRGIRKATSENERGIREEYDQNMWYTYTKMSLQNLLSYKDNICY